jgi:glutathione reductase (NADPH)
VPGCTEFVYPLSMSKHYDIVILGSGAVGQTVAFRAQKSGLTVVVLESQTPGGTCPNRGCDAKKPYVNAAGLSYRVGCLSKIRGGIEPAALSWRAIAQFKKYFTDPVGELTTTSLQNAGIDIVQGEPAFVNSSTVMVGKQLLTADRFVLATGHRPRVLNIPGVEHTINSDELLDLNDIPRRVAFIGGGYIGMEFACAAAIAGHEVAVVSAGSKTLEAFDPYVVTAMERALPELGPHGVNVIANSRVGAVTRSDNGEFTIHSDDQHSTPLVTADLVVNSSGRVPSVEGLNLDAAGINYGPHGIEIDQYLRCTGDNRAWAGGDVAATGRPGLIPTAVDDGRILAHNLFEAETESDMRQRSTAPYCSVVFTTPAVAAAGFTETEARSKFSDDIHVIEASMATKKYFRELGQPDVAYKLIFSNDCRLLGAHFIGEGADEVINLFGLALGQVGDTHSLYSTTLTYPSIGSALQGVFRKAVDTVNQMQS